MQETEAALRILSLNKYAIHQFKNATLKNLLLALFYRKVFLKYLNKGHSVFNI